MANLVPPRNLQTTVRFFWPTSQLKCEQREVLLLTAVARSWEDSRGKAFDVFITDVFGSNSSKAAIREAAKGYAPTRVAWVRGTASGHVGSEASALITDVNWVLEGERLAGRGILLPSTLRTTHAQSNVQLFLYDPGVCDPASWQHPGEDAGTGQGQSAGQGTSLRSALSHFLASQGLEHLDSCQSQNVHVQPGGLFSQGMSIQQACQQLLQAWHACTPTPHPQPQPSLPRSGSRSPRSPSPPTTTKHSAAPRLRSRHDRRAAVMLCASFGIQWALGVWLCGLLVRHHVQLAQGICHACRAGAAWLDSQVAWLMTAQPAGIKLHAELCTLLGMSMQQMMRGLTALATPAVADRAASLLVCLVAGACGITGLVGGLAIAEDALYIIAAPVLLLYWAMCLLVRKHLEWLGSTWQMMRGRFKRPRPRALQEGSSASHAAGAGAAVHAGESTGGLTPSQTISEAGTDAAGYGGRQATTNAPWRLLRRRGSTGEQGGIKGAKGIKGIKGANNGHSASASTLQPLPSGSASLSRGSSTSGVPAAVGLNAGRLQRARSYSAAAVAAVVVVVVPLSRLEALLGLPTDPKTDEVVVEQLIVGVLLFVPLLVLLPTTAAFYLLALTAYAATAACRLGLRLCRGLLVRNPLVLLACWVAMPRWFPGAFSVRLLAAGTTSGTKAAARRSITSTNAQSTGAAMRQAAVEVTAYCRLCVGAQPLASAAWHWLAPVLGGGSSGAGAGAAMGMLTSLLCGRPVM